MTAVSVVVPTRNRSALLAVTLRGVLAQRAVDLEVIVVDEGSSDDTPAVLAGFADHRVHTIRNPAPRGLSGARNQGAARARGAWLAFVDDDDVWAPDKLDAQVAAAGRHGRDWAYVGAVNVADDLTIVSASPAPGPADVVASLPRYNPVPGGGSNVIVRRPLFEAVGGFDERFSACADWELWARLARVGPPACAARPLLGYRLHSGSMSLDAGRIRREAALLEQVHATTIDWGRLHRWLAESHLRVESHLPALGHFAQAALKGQARGVASDLAAIMRRRARRMTGRSEPPAVAQLGSWGEEAEQWLRVLRRPWSAGGDSG